MQNVRMSVDCSCTVRRSWTAQTRASRKERAVWMTTAAFHPTFSVSLGRVAAAPERRAGPRKTGSHRQALSSACWRAVASRKNTDMAALSRRNRICSQQAGTGTVSMAGVLAGDSGSILLPLRNRLVDIPNQGTDQDN